MGKLEKKSSTGNVAKGNSYNNDTKMGKFKDGKIGKTDKKNKKQVLRGANAWRDVDDRPKEEIALENFENRKLYKMNDKGEKVKEFHKKGAVRPWLDLKFEENEKMTYYEGFFVKKSDVEVLDKLRQDMEFQEVDKYTVKRKMMKAIRKSKRELFKEMLYEEKLKQIKEGTYKGPVKVWNKKDKAGNTKLAPTEGNQQSVQLPNNIGSNIRSNETNAKEDTKMKINTPEKKEPSKCPNSIEGLDLNYEFGPISDENSETIISKKGNSLAEDSAEAMEFNGIPYMMVETNLDKLDDSDQQSDAESETELKENISSTNIEIDQESKTVPTVAKLVFEENKMMTCVDGFWIRRNNLLEVDELRAAKKKEIIAKRTSESDSPGLSKSEEKQFKIAMNVALLKMANLLRAHLTKRTKKRALYKANRPKVDPSKVASKKTPGGVGLKARGDGKKFPQKGLREMRGGQSRPQYGRDNRSDFRDSSALKPWQKTDPSKPGLVRFDGYWIKKEAADRLRELKDNLKKEGVPTTEIAEVVKVERRREESELKNQRKTVCFSCRQPGHQVADCPLKQNTAGVGSCFKCGSSEHQSSSCTSTSTAVPTSGAPVSDYSYATCFICRQRGHISKECPRNTRGLYPDGGGCTLCDSNQHLIKNCPRNQDEKQGASKEVRATTFRPGQLLEVDDADNGPTHDAAPKRLNKHIKF